MREVLERVREVALGGYSHQEMPFMLVTANFSPTGFTFDRSPFQALFMFQNAPTKTHRFGDLLAEPGEDVDRGATDVELTLAVRDRGRDLQVSLTYDLDLFDSSTVDQMLRDYGAILEDLARHPQLKVSEATSCASRVSDPIVT